MTAASGRPETSATDSRGQRSRHTQFMHFFFSLDVHSNSFLDLMLIQIVFFSCGNTAEHGVGMLRGTRHGPENRHSCYTFLPIRSVSTLAAFFSGISFPGVLVESAWSEHTEESVSGFVLF